MKIKAEEITSVLRKQIEQYRTALDVADVGRVLEVGDGIARVYGLSNAMAAELVEFEGGILGQVLNLEQNSIGVAIFGNYLEIKEGQQVRGTGRVLEVPVGPEMVGRVVDALGRPIDGKGPIAT